VVAANTGGWPAGHSSAFMEVLGHSGAFFCSELQDDLVQRRDADDDERSLVFSIPLSRFTPLSLNKVCNNMVLQGA